MTFPEGGNGQKIPSSPDPDMLPVVEPQSGKTMTWIYAGGGPVIVVWNERVLIGGMRKRVGGRWIAIPERDGDRWLVRLHRVLRHDRPVDKLSEQCRLWANRQRAEVSA